MVQGSAERKAARTARRISFVPQMTRQMSAAPIAAMRQASKQIEDYGWFRQVRGESWTMFATAQRFDKILSLHLCPTSGFLLANWPALFQTLRKVVSFK